MRQALFAVFLTTGLALPARALGPHELLLLANSNSPASVEVAKNYARLRQVPDCNLVLLDLPPATWVTPYEISTNDFTDLIWAPARRALRERGIDDHILAWAYSIDMPVRIRTDPRVSITGLTFVRNQLPSNDSVARGLYGSALFAGPDNPAVEGFPSQSLDNQRAWLGSDMPIPAMMLGFAGDHGNTRAEIDACLRRGAESDSTFPAGTVYLATNSDIRTRCRMWQFPAAARELKEAHVPVVITDALPTDLRPIAGILHGLVNIDLSGKHTFVPGCMAEHLTSFGAMFDNGDQMKLTAWIRAGATASGGTITEPMAIWTKFPHARYFVHAAAGGTVMESFYQSVKCPLQFLPVGEPLAAPWRPAARLALHGLPESPLRTPTTVSTSVQCDAGHTFSRTLFLLDGHTLQPAGNTTSVTLSPAGLTSGTHTLRAVAYSIGSMRHQVFSEATFRVE